MDIPETLVELVAEFEGFKAEAYQDIGGVWTCGYGTTGPDIHKGTTFTKEEALQRLSETLQSIWNQIEQKTSIALTSKQMEALSSFAYNLGTSALFKSTLWKYLEEGEIEQAAQEFPKWSHVNGKVITGLLKRRVKEQELFLS
ncbi:lysozyme [Acetobacter tropicalis]|uniref:lysozyme n=1 Tax=Acetobacter tropicalis TaxID=104102 RepID=UPI0005872FF4|nr:lysozyme [Acetobacter tropicalis]